MKFILTQTDVIRACSEMLQGRFQSGCQFDLQNYVYIPDLTFMEMTDEYKEAKAAHEADLEVFRKKMEADAAEKKAIKVELAADMADLNAPF